MATYRLSVSVAKRSGGRSATAMAAYRAGELVEDLRTGRVYDYRRKSGVLYAEIFAPEDAPEWAFHRSELWNRSEEAERKGNAVIAREIQLSLPHELTNAERHELTARFAKHISQRYGIAVDACIHAPSRSNDQRNYHAHLLLCQRPFDAAQETGLSKTKIREFDAIASQRSRQNNQVEQWREAWAQMINCSLRNANIRTENGTLAEVNCHGGKEKHIGIESRKIEIFQNKVSSPEIC